ncbi:uncharacterized protein LOC119354524 [Triticum dicoccoides]|uniref:uncharacterized protein LOC119354524 n=1 Tax=Triticum dicoccoides TaxID=85692 RepID=UPI0018901486|nr:uncharacterized protein LOC119354524 [Triticum dicoccoides]
MSPNSGTIRWCPAHPQLPLAMLFIIHRIDLIYPVSCGRRHHFHFLGFWWWGGPHRLSPARPRGGGDSTCEMLLPDKVVAGSPSFHRRIRSSPTRPLPDPLLSDSNAYKSARPRQQQPTSKWPILSPSPPPMRIQDDDYHDFADLRSLLLDGRLFH